MQERTKGFIFGNFAAFELNFEPSADQTAGFEQFWNLPLKRNGPENCSARARARAHCSFGAHCFSLPLTKRLVLSNSGASPSEEMAPKTAVRARARARAHALQLWGSFFQPSPDQTAGFEQFWSLSLRRNGPKNCSARARARARALQLWGSFFQPFPDQMVDFGFPWASGPRSKTLCMSKSELRPRHANQFRFSTSLRAPLKNPLHVQV